MRLSTIFSFVLLVCATNPGWSQSNSFLAVSFGVLGIDDENLALDYRVEYRAPAAFKSLSPTIGIQATSHGSVYSFWGLSRDIRLAPELYLIPSLVAGAYHKGSGKNLGGIIEFRSGLEFSLKVRPRMRASVAVHHLSNSSIYDHNPGIESVVLTYYFMLSR